MTIARAELQEQNLETADRGSLAEEVWQRKASLMLLLTLLVTSLKIPASYEDVVIDLSKAELDEETGNFCVVQKVGGLLSACITTKSLAIKLALIWFSPVSLRNKIVSRQYSFRDKQERAN